MVVVSRELFKYTVNGKTCQFFIHPHEPRCSVALVNLAGTVLKGSAKYFFLMYLAQNALKYKTLTKDDILPTAVSYVRSVVFGTWAVCAYPVAICLWKNISGTLEKNVVSYGAGLAGGLGIFLDDPKRRPIVAYTVAALGVEALIRRLYKKVKRRKSLETLLFMTLNAILMYKMRTSRQAVNKRDLWFYRPPLAKKNKQLEEVTDVETGEILTNVCPHTEKVCSAKQCCENVVKETSKYYLGAMLFSTIRLLFANPQLRRHPIVFLKTLFQWKNMKLASYLQCYIGVYKAISCCLCRWTKRDKPEYALLAGFFSGLSYGLNPNLTILATLILYVSRIIGREAQEKYQLPRCPSIELNFIFGITTLCNTRIFEPACCPGGFIFMLDTISQRQFDSLFSNFLKVIEDHRKMMNEL